MSEMSNKDLRSIFATLELFVDKLEEGDKKAAKAMISSLKKCVKTTEIFNPGDIVIGLPDNEYNGTTDKCLLYIHKVNREDSLFDGFAIYHETCPNICGYMFQNLRMNGFTKIGTAYDLCKPIYEFTKKLSDDESLT